MIGIEVARLNFEKDRLFSISAWTSWIQQPTLWATMNICFLFESFYGNYMQMLAAWAVGGPVTQACALQGPFIGIPFRVHGTGHVADVFKSAGRNSCITSKPPLALANSAGWAVQWLWTSFLRPNVSFFVLFLPFCRRVVGGDMQDRMGAVSDIFVGSKEEYCLLWHIQFRLVLRGLFINGSSGTTVPPLRLSLLFF